mgnify:CR=1 FL=1
MILLLLTACLSRQERLEMEYARCITENAPSNLEHLIPCIHIKRMYDENWETSWKEMLETWRLQ